MLADLGCEVQECDYYLPDTIPAGQTVRGFIKVKAEYTDIEFKASMTIQAIGDGDSRISIPIRRKFY